MNLRADHADRSCPAEGNPYVNALDPSARSGDEPDEAMTAAERRLLTAAVEGRFVVVRPGSIARHEELHDPAEGPLWTDDQTIRAPVLADLLTGARQPGDRPPRFVRVHGARITGTLHLIGATLVCPLWLQDCQIDQPVNFNEATVPSIRMTGCRVPLLVANGLRTTGDLMLDNGFTAREGVELYGARIGGTLCLGKATIAELNASRIAVEQGATFRHASCTGEITLTGARIGGQLDFGNAALDNPGGRALQAERLTVTDNLLFNDGFTAKGEVCLSGAAVSGDLDFSGARLSNPGGTALLADSLAVAQCVFCRDGFRADGQVRMLSAKVGEAFSLEGATLDNPDGDALYAVRLDVEGDLYARRNFAARGCVQLSGARIRGLIDMTGVSLSHPGKQVLDLYAATAAELHLLPDQAPDGTINLTNARVGVFEDAPATWPAFLLLRGFTYDSFHKDTADVPQRLQWLARDPGGYAPEIYDQLASVYRRAGREDDARRVGLAKQRRRRQALNLPGKALGRLLDLTVGYGYRTWKAGAWLAVLTILGTVAFSRIHMVPSAARPSGFSPLGYTLDLLIPVADLGQKNSWHPSGHGLYLAWLLRAVGWILTTAVVAAVTGLLKRD